MVEIIENKAENRGNSIIEFFRGLVIVTAEAERKARLDRTRAQGTMTAKRAKEAGCKSKGLEGNEEKEKEEEEKEKEGGMNMELDEQDHNEHGGLGSKLLNDDEEMYQPPSLATSTKKTSPRNLSSAQVSALLKYNPEIYLRHRF